MRQLRLHGLFALLFWLTFHTISARADLTFTTEFRRAGYDHDPDKAERTVVTYIKGDSRRVEHRWNITNTDSTVSSGHVTFLLLGAKRQQITLHDDTRTYRVETLKDLVLKRGTHTADGKLRIFDDTTPATKTASITVSVIELNEEIISGVKTRHYNTSYLEKLSDESWPNKFTSDVWVTTDLESELRKQPTERLAPVLQCERLPSPWRSFWNPAYKTEIEGKVDIYNRLKSGFIMRSRTSTGIMVGAKPPPPKKFTGGEIIEIREVTSLSRAPLDDALFTIPPDYKEVVVPDDGVVIVPVPKPKQ